jgi:putative ABC transport system permease protein
LVVRTNAHDNAFVDDVSARLKQAYEARSMKVAFTMKQYEEKRTNDFQFGIVVSFLLALAVMIAGVGGIALMGALSIGVVERTKEIGVLRAIGARSRTIMGMFVMEGVLQGVLSWAIAVPLSFIIARPMADALGKIMFNASLDYAYNLTAVGIWLAIILVISVVASALPARNATRISVRDSLAYA